MVPGVCARCLADRFGLAWTRGRCCSTLWMLRCPSRRLCRQTGWCQQGRLGRAGVEGMLRWAGPLDAHVQGAYQLWVW